MKIKKRQVIIFLFVIFIVVLAVVVNMFFYVPPKKNNTIKSTAEGMNVLSSGEYLKTTAPLLKRIAPLHAGNIFISYGGNLYQLDTDTMQEKLFTIPGVDFHLATKGYPNDIAFSQDGKYLFFSLNDNIDVLYTFATKKYYLLKGLGIKSMQVMDKNPKKQFFYFLGVGQYNNPVYRIYDASDGKIYDKNPIPYVSDIDSIDFSPKGTYVVIHTTQHNIITQANGDSMAFLDHEGELFWTPNEMKFAISVGTVNINPYPVGPMYSNSIFVYSFDKSDQSIQLASILNATFQQSYSLVGWKDNDTLMYEKDTFTFPIFPAMSNIYLGQDSAYWDNILKSPQKTFWQRDFLTGKVRQTQLSTNPIQKTTVSQLQYPTFSVSGDGHWQIVGNGDNLTIQAYHQLSPVYPIGKFSYASWQP